MLNIAICDDNEQLCSILEDKVIIACNNFGEKAGTDVFYSGEDLCRFIENGCHYDLIYLDIDLITMSGIEIGKKIRNEQKDYDTQIVFISGREDYAMELFQIRPIDFLIKPLQLVQIEKTIAAVLKWEQHKNPYFEFMYNHNIIRIKTDDIFYFYSQGKKVNIVLANEKMYFYDRLAEVKAKLPQYNFIEIHKSYIVNYIHVIKYSYEEVTMENNEVLPISLKHRKAVREWLFQKNRSANI